MLVVQMVRALVWTARGVGLSPTWHYPFPCFGIVCDNILLFRHKINQHTEPNLQHSVLTNKPDQMAELLEATRKMTKYFIWSLKHNPSHSSNTNNCAKLTQVHLTQTSINVNLITTRMR